MDNEKEKLRCLNDLIEDIDCLNELDEYLSIINIFDILKIGGMEIRHSNFLAWLLNPYESHGLGDKFLKKFLIGTIKKYDDLFEVSVIDLELMNLYDFKVYRELYNIDLLLISDENKFIIAIENKIYSKESKDQLKKYREVLDTRYGNEYRYLRIFLTPNGYDPSDLDNWIKSDYSIINKLIDELLSKEELEDRQRIYIEDYNNTLRRYVVEDEKIRKICEKIYQSHKEALDLIYDNIPNSKNLFSKDILKYLQNNEEKLDIKVSKNNTSTYIRFLPNELSQFISGKGSTIWVEEEWLLLFEVTINKEGPLTMRIVIGPAKEGFEKQRDELCEFLTTKEKVHFKFKGLRLYNRYKTIDTEVIIKEDLSQIVYDDSVMELFIENLDKYFKDKLPEKINAIKNYFLNNK